ncbi:methyltransferase domain-containing protein [Comamonas faecalis]|uniref:Methyltransferase domain-containing protein n=1 Tax=Comamonas faecalis TaxID=1387849 RepID=A0ABP7RZ39_9BURK
MTSPPGSYLLAWEQERFDELVADLFGYHALQLGLPALQGLRANRMPHRWLAQNAAAPLQQGTALLLDAQALPFGEASLDLVLMPHTLETSGAPHAALREAARVLVPQGRVVISGFNPWSLWGLRQRRGQLYQRLGAGVQPFLPDALQLITPGRVRDWLQLLDFEVESVSFGCFRPAVRSAPWLQHWAWMDDTGPRWWPVLGAAYVVVAVKRVLGMHLLQPAWRAQRQKAQASVPVARRGN